VTTLVNLCRDRFRRLGVRDRSRASLALHEERASRLEESVVARTTVQAALGRLSPRRRAVVVLHEIEGVPARLGKEESR
jgi:DNA-directed RNA polymerase specialized sigma24 family protein